MHRVTVDIDVTQGPPVPSVFVPRRAGEETPVYACKERYRERLAVPIFCSQRNRFCGSPIAFEADAVYGSQIAGDFGFSGTNMEACIGGE